MATYSKTGIGFLRELESHLAALEIQVQAGTLPIASATCARRILADALSAFCEETSSDLPAIKDEDAVWSECATTADAVARGLRSSTN